MKKQKKFGCEVEIRGKIIVINDASDKDSFIRWLDNVPLETLLDYAFDMDVETEVKEVWSEGSK